MFASIIYNATLTKQQLQAAQRQLFTVCHLAPVSTDNGGARQRKSLQKSKRGQDTAQAEQRKVEDQLVHRREGILVIWSYFG